MPNAAFGEGTGQTITRQFQCTGAETVLFDPDTGPNSCMTIALSACPPRSRNAGVICCGVGEQLQ